MVQQLDRTETTTAPAQARETKQRRPGFFSKENIARALGSLNGMSGQQGDKRIWPPRG